MPTAAKKKASTTTSKTPAKPAPSKAQQAAQHQNRPAVPAEPRRQASPPRQEVATRPRGAVVDPATVAHLPAFMQADAGQGLQNIDNSDIVIPRLKMMQGLSPELQEFDGLKIGHFFHPAAEFIFDGPVRAVPLYYDKRYILWRPRDMGGGILARADDGVHWSPSRGEFKVKLDKKDGGAEVTWRMANTVLESGLATWGSMNPNDKDSPPAATLTYNFLLAFPDEPQLMPAIFSFQRTAIGEGRKFLTKLKTQRAPIYGTIWEFSSATSTGKTNSNEFQVPVVKGAGLLEDESLYQQYKSMYETYTDKGVSIKDIEGLQDEDTASVNNADQGEESAEAPRY